MNVLTVKAEALREYVAATCHGEEDYQLHLQQCVRMIEAAEQLENGTSIGLPTSGTSTWEARVKAEALREAADAAGNGALLATNLPITDWLRRLADAIEEGCDQP